MKKSKFVQKIKGIDWKKSPIVSTMATTLILIIIFTIFNSNFLTWPNFTTIFLNASIIGIFSTGMTMLLIGGNVDLSAASTAAISVMSFGLLYKNGVPLLLGALLCLVVGMLAGLVNGLLVAKAQLPSMMVTIANMLTFRAIGYALSNVQAVVITDTAFFAFGRRTIFGIPVSVFYMILVFLIIGYVLERTAFGRRIYAVGGNMQASYYSGINIDRTIIQSFMVMGVVAGFAGLVSASQTGATVPSIMYGREFDFVSPCVIGGIAMSGGKGKIFGTFLGCILLAIVANGMVMAGLQSYWQDMVKGLILIFAMWVDAIRNRRDLA